MNGGKSDFQDGYVYRFPLWRLMLFPLSWKIFAKEPINPPGMKEAEQWRNRIMAIALLLPLYAAVVTMCLDLLPDIAKQWLGVKFRAKEIWSPGAIIGGTVVAAIVLNYPVLFLGSFARSKIIETWPATFVVKSAILCSLVLMTVPLLLAYTLLAYASLAKQLGAGEAYLMMMATMLSSGTGVVGYWFGYFWGTWREA